MKWIFSADWIYPKRIFNDYDISFVYNVPTFYSMYIRKPQGAGLLPLDRFFDAGKIFRFIFVFATYRNDAR